MTLRSLKKRRITAPRFIPTRLDGTGRRTLLRAAMLIAIAGSVGAANAQSPPPTAQSTTPEGWNLRWRKSSQVAPKPVHIPREDVFAQPAHAQPATSHPATAQPATNQPAARPIASHPAPLTPTTLSVGTLQPAPQRSSPQRSSPLHSVSQRTATGIAAHQPSPQSQQVSPTQNAFRNATTPRQFAQNQPQRPAFEEIRSTVRLVDHEQPVTQPSARPNVMRADSVGAMVTNANANDFFNNPFGDARIPSTVESNSNAVRFAQGTAPATSPGLPPIDQTPDVVPAAPQARSILIPETLPQENNAPSIPDASGGNTLPAPVGNAPELPTPGNDLRAPGTQAELPPPANQPAESGLRGLLEQGGESLEAPRENIAPGAAAGGTQSPSDLESEEPYKNPFQQPEGAIRSPRQSVITPNELSCEDFRARIASDTIDKLTLDISPPFRPDVFDPDEYEKQRQRFDRDQKMRDWKDIRGTTVATGRLVDLAYERVVIENESGARQQLSVHRIGESDLAYLSANWGLPKECLIEQVAYQPRNWTPLTMTWKASNLCSKQRYFEEVNLERYGHTAGPVLQPIVSSAHFFANIAVLPYKMGIHPPNECHYALGYYRPGNCAPWIVPPVPISPRGALAQGAFVSGLYWLIP